MFEEFCDTVLAEMQKNSLGQHGSAQWANMKISKDSEANVVVFSSGWGDRGLLPYGAMIKTATSPAW